MNKLITAIALSTILLGPTIARADDQADLDKIAAALNTQAKTTDGRQRVLAAISKETGVQVATLEAQKKKTGLGFGELLIANSLASATGKTFDEIVALKTSGQGWGKVAKANNLKLGDVVSKARHADQAAQPARGTGAKGTSGTRGGGAGGRGGGGGRGR